jgi:hypothetical protein
MTEEARPFRYHDEARRLDEELAEIKVAEPKSKPPAPLATGGLERIAKGETAFGAMPADRAAVLASIPQDMKKHEVKQKLQTLLAKKHTKVAEFISQANKVADLAASDVVLNSTTEGTGSGPAERENERHLDAHQGPAANLIAAGLKAAKGSKSRL